MSTGDIRYDDGPIKELARAEGWVMVRRPGCIPYCKRASEWDVLRRAPENVSRQPPFQSDNIKRIIPSDDRLTQDLVKFAAGKTDAKD